MSETSYGRPRRPSIGCTTRNIIPPITPRASTGRGCRRFGKGGATGCLPVLIAIKAAGR